MKFFSLNLILIYILNHFYHFQPFLYYEKCAYLKEVIRRDFDQCALPYLTVRANTSLHCTSLLISKWCWFIVVMFFCCCSILETENHRFSNYFCIEGCMKRMKYIACNRQAWFKSGNKVELKVKKNNDKSWEKNLQRSKRRFPLNRVFQG